MVLSMMALATMDAVAKYLTQAYSIPQILCVRFWIFLGFALLLTRPQGPVRALTATRRPWLQVARSLVLLAEMMVFLAAFSVLPLADVHAVAAVSPLITMALAAVFLGERIGPHRWTAVAFGLVGVLVIIRPGAGIAHWASILPLAAAFLWALYQILVRLVGRVDSSATTVLYTALTGAVLFTVAGPIFWRPLDGEALALMLLLGLLGSAGHWLLVLALRAAPAGTLQPYSYTLVLWAAVMGWLVFGDVPDAWTLSGGALVVASGLYALFRERRAGAALRLTPR